MIAEEKLQAFVEQAMTMWLADRQAGHGPATDPPGSLFSDQVFARLQWSGEDARYFQEDADNLLRELEYQGAVVIWDESRRAAVRTAPAGLVYTFTLTDKGQAQGRHHM